MLCFVSFVVKTIGSKSEALPSFVPTAISSHSQRITQCRGSNTDLPYAKYMLQSFELPLWPRKICLSFLIYKVKMKNEQG